MKQRLNSGLTILLIFWASMSVSLPLIYVEDQHYKRTAELIATNSEKPEVVELFLYTCPHCFYLEDEVKNWHVSVGDSIDFKRVPAVFGPRQVPLANAFYAAEALGKLEQLHALFFEAIHEDEIVLSSENQILDYVEQQGVDRKSFEKMMNSFAVKSKVKQAQAYTQRSGVNGVPSFVVNGRYQTSGPMAGSLEGIFDVIDYLTTSKKD